MKKLLRRLTAVALLAVTPLAAAAEDAWPSKPIKIIVPFPAGGQADIVTRLIADQLGPILGQPVVVEAQPGAGGNIGTEAVVKSPADGYTWLSSGVPLTTAPSMYPGTLGFDPEKDLVPVIRFGSTSFVLAVPPDLGVKTVDELVAYAKEHQGELSYAGSGVGSLVHLVSELFKLENGLDIQMIPYNGQPPAIADLLANRVQFMVIGISLAKPLIESGQLVALAVMDDQRHPLLPDVPSIAEAGYPTLVASGWAGYNMPAGTPQDIVDRVNAAVAEVVTRPEVVDAIQKVGWSVVPPQSPAEFGEFLTREIARWGKVVEQAGVKAE